MGAAGSSSSDLRLKAYSATFSTAAMRLNVGRYSKRSWDPLHLPVGKDPMTSDQMRGSSFSAKQHLGGCSKASHIHFEPAPVIVVPKEDHWSNFCSS